MSAWTEARDRQMIADGWVKRPDGYWEQPKVKLGPNYVEPVTKGLVGSVDLALPGTDKTVKRIISPPEEPKPRLNKTEAKACKVLVERGFTVWQQAITLALDPPFKSYRADLAYMHDGYLHLVEVKAPHRFARAGIAKAALAAKTYPEFRFHLFMWTKGAFKESLFCP